MHGLRTCITYWRHTLRVAHCAKWRHFIPVALNGGNVALLLDRWARGGVVNGKKVRRNEM